MSQDAKEIDPLRLLQDELKDASYEHIVNTINCVTVVAKAIGAERTRKELIPLLVEFSEEDNDEAHMSVARQLGDFVPLLGGAQYAKIILPLLEKLCGEEEVVVREAAVKALNTAVHQFPKEDVHGEYQALIQRMATSAWFASRVSAAGVIPQAFAASQEVAVQDELRKTFILLCKDETPMVRRAAFIRLGEFTLMVKPFFKTDILPII